MVTDYCVPRTRLENIYFRHYFWKPYIVSLKIWLGRESLKVLFDLLLSVTWVWNFRSFWHPESKMILFPFPTERIPPSASMTCYPGSFHLYTINFQPLWLDYLLPPASLKWAFPCNLSLAPHSLLLLFPHTFWPFPRQTHILLTAGHVHLGIRGPVVGW